VTATSPIPPEAQLAAVIRELVRAEVDQRVTAALVGRSAGVELLTTAEAAAHAKVAPETIRRWIAAGRLPEHRAGREVRIGRADLDQLLHRGTRGPKPQSSARSPEELGALAAEKFR
jgi:excisionase family DNA binding protein